VEYGKEKKPLIVLKREHIEEICHRVSTWEKNAENFLGQMNEIANMWRLKAPKHAGGDTQLTNTRTAELVRASESISTLMYRMMTANDPNFDTVPRALGQNTERLNAISTLLQWQQMHLKYRKNLKEALSSLAVFGTTICEERWKMTPNAMNTNVEGTILVPRSLSQVAFNTSVHDISESDWFATLDFLTPHALRSLATNNPQVWDKDEIEKAIEAGKDRAKIPEKIKDRRRAAGYDEEDDNILLVTTFHGHFDDFPGEDGKNFVISIVNDEFQVAGHTNPFDHGELPFRVAGYMKFELEPYYYGIGRIGFLPHRQLDAVRNMTMDTIIMALFNMWSVSTMSDIKGDTMKMVPLGIVRSAGKDGITPLRPDLNAAKAGMDLDALIKEEYRAASGATYNLQGIVTEATATESAIVQNEAIRRVSVYAEIAAEELVRKHLYMSHRNNMQFLNRDIWLTVSGEEKPARVNKDIINMDVDFIIRITTDKDYRPQRMQSLIQALQIISSVRQDVPNAASEVQVLWREIKRMFGIHSGGAQEREAELVRAIVQEEMQKRQTQAGSLNQLQNGLDSAQSMATNLPPDNMISPPGTPGAKPLVEPISLS
jgi:hypothetical protein